MCCFGMLKTNTSVSLSVQMANQVAQAQSKAQAALQALQDQMQQHLEGEQSLESYAPYLPSSALLFSQHKQL